MAKVFISHSTHDRSFVESEILPILHAGGIACWYGKDDIPTSAVWEREIIKALESCDTFLLVMTPEAAKSEWVRDELNFALDRFAHNRLILVLRKPCKLSDFHIRLPRIQHIDYSDDPRVARKRLIACLAALSPPAGAIQKQRPNGAAGEEAGPVLLRDTRKKVRYWMLVPAVCLMVAVASVFAYVVLHSRNKDEGGHQQDTSVDPLKRSSRLPINWPRFPNSEMWENKLQQVVDYDGEEDPKTTLKEGLDRLAKKYQLAFDIDEHAFKDEGVMDVARIEIASPNPLPKMHAPVEEVIGAMLRRIPVPSNAYSQIRNDHLRITTGEFRRVTVESTIESLPLWELLDYLEDNFGYGIDRTQTRDKENQSVRVVATRDVRLRVLVTRALRQVGIDYDPEGGGAGLIAQPGGGALGINGGLAGLGGIGGIAGGGIAGQPAGNSGSAKDR